MLASYRGSFRDRVVGAALLDENVYEYVKLDRSAMWQAALVVVLAALAAGMGTLSGGLAGLAVGVVTALLGWAAYAYVAYWVGTRWFKAEVTSATRGDLLRTLGFASSPRLLLVLGVVPLLGGLVTLLVFVWTLGTTFVAIRQALELDFWRAMATATLSWLALFVISFVVTSLLT